MKIRTRLEIPNRAMLKQGNQKHRDWAVELERQADLGLSIGGLPFPGLYVEAAKYRIRAGQICKAINNYKRAIQIYNDISQGETELERKKWQVWCYGEAAEESQKAQRNVNRLGKVERGEWRGLLEKTAA